MKLKSAAVLAGLCALIGCWISEEARQIKLCQDMLRPLMGRKEKEVKKRITDGSSFELLDSWMGENPSVETVLKNNYRINGFSRQEAREVFAVPGFYNVEIYLKRQAAEGGRIEQINSIGQTIPERRKTLASEIYTCFRVVFRDSALIRYDVWTQ